MNNLGNVINVVTGEWIGSMSGIGAGMDSFYEYLLKVKLLQVFCLYYFGNQYSYLI